MSRSARDKDLVLAFDGDCAFYAWVAANRQRMPAGTS